MTNERDFGLPEYRRWTPQISFSRSHQLLLPGLPDFLASSYMEESVEVDDSLGHLQKWIKLPPLYFQCFYVIVNTLVEETGNSILIPIAGLSYW